MAELVSSLELADWLDSLLRGRTIVSLVAEDSGAYKAIVEVRHRKRAWCTYWRADTICSALGRPDVLQGLTRKEAT